MVNSQLGFKYKKSNSYTMKGFLDYIVHFSSNCQSLKYKVDAIPPVVETVQPVAESG